MFQRDDAAAAAAVEAAKELFRGLEATGEIDSETLLRYSKLRKTVHHIYIQLLQLTSLNL